MAKNSAQRRAGSYISKGRTNEDLINAAVFHEAGHVVAAVALGIEVHYCIVEYKQRGKRSSVHGYTELILGKSETRQRALDEARAPEVLRRRAIHALAGHIAEGWANSDPQDVERGATDDFHAAAGFAVLAMQPNPEQVGAIIAAYMNERRREAEVLLRVRVPALNAVAQHLGANLNTAVDGETLRALVQAQPLTEDAASEVTEGRA